MEVSKQQRSTASFVIKEVEVKTSFCMCVWWGELGKNEKASEDVKRKAPYTQLGAELGWAP